MFLASKENILKIALKGEHIARWASNLTSLAQSAKHQQINISVLLKEITATQEFSDLASNCLGVRIIETNSQT